VRCRRDAGSPPTALRRWTSGWWRIWARWRGCQNPVWNASLLDEFAVSMRTFSAEEAWRLPVPRSCQCVARRCSEVPPFAVVGTKQFIVLPLLISFKYNLAELVDPICLLSPPPSSGLLQTVYDMRGSNARPIYPIPHINASLRHLTPRFLATFPARI
jgi:hypothetical protein